jgi:hypothetical protein
MEDQVLMPEDAGVPTDEMSFGSRFINVFVNPMNTFKSLYKRPTWLAPMLIVLAVITISVQITYPIQLDAQLKAMRNNPNMTTEQLNMQIQWVANHPVLHRIITAVAALFFVTVIYYFILSLIFYFVGSIILGGDCSYKKVLSIWSWISLIGIVETIVIVPLTLAKGSIIKLSPALLLSGDAIDTTLYTILSQLNFFTIWQLAVFAFGFATIYRFSVSKGYIAIGTLWGIWIALATIFSSTLKKFGMM